MPLRNRLWGAIGALTGLAYVILVLVGASGVIWVIPAVVAGVAFSIVSTSTRGGPGRRADGR